MKDILIIGAGGCGREVVQWIKDINSSKPTWNINDSVIVNGITPIINKVAKKNKLQVVDLHTCFAGEGDKMLADGIHPDAKGARRLAEIVAEALRKK